MVKPPKLLDVNKNPCEDGYEPFYGHDLEEPIDEPVDVLGKAQSALQPFHKYSPDQPQLPEFIVDDFGTGKAATVQVPYDQLEPEILAALAADGDAEAAAAYAARIA